jgi:hypothetical protein
MDLNAHKRLRGAALCEGVLDDVGDQDNNVPPAPFLGTDRCRWAGAMLRRNWEQGRRTHTTASSTTEAWMSTSVSAKSFGSAVWTALK